MFAKETTCFPKPTGRETQVILPYSLLYLGAVDQGIIAVLCAFLSETTGNKMRSLCVRWAPCEELLGVTVLHAASFD